MALGSELGASLGVRIAQIGSRVREVSLARTTPALVQQASAIADQMAARRAEAVRQRLVGWLEAKGIPVPAEGELGGLLGGIVSVGGWLAQNVIATAIGFGVGQSLSAVLNPYFTELVQAAWRSNPNQVLTPAELATAVLRGYLDADTAAAEAAASGIDAERFRIMVENAGSPPGASELLALWRRGVISDEDLERGLRQSGLRPEWIETVKRMGVQWPSYQAFLDAYLEGQVDEASARRLYERAGGDPELFDLLYNTQGQAPTPTQALELLNRGIIPERGTGPDAVSYEQAFLEGPWRNKWLEPFLALREYVVPPRSVKPMVASGAWSVERGIEELRKSGVPEDTARAILEEAASSKLAPERDLVKSDVLAAAKLGLMGHDEAVDALGVLGYSRDEAELLLAIQDARYEAELRDSLVNRIKTLYLGHRIDEDEAQAALARLGLGGEPASKLLALWDVVRETPTAELTEAQARAAAKAGVWSPERYRQWLLDHGYTEEDADTLMATYKIGARGGT